MRTQTVLQNICYTYRLTRTRRRRRSTWIIAQREKKKSTSKTQRIIQPRPELEQVGTRGEPCVFHVTSTG